MPKKLVPPSRPAVDQNRQRNILELDRFSKENLDKWQELSQKLDSLEWQLYFGLEPARRAKRAELLQALQLRGGIAVDLRNWVRLVTYEFSNNPLSSAGSLHDYGGRFNAGIDLDPNTLNPWPALYIAQDHETAFREKFQLASNSDVAGLSPQELALEQKISYSAVFLNGRLGHVFDVRTPDNLAVLAKLLGTIRMPEEAKRLMRSLHISTRSLYMIRTAKQLHDNLLERNWRVLPVQFGLPAHSHVIAELIRAAGYEGILYRSTKGNGDCLAIFPDTIANGSFVELRDAAPQAVQYRRLDSETSDELSGWNSLPRNYLNRLT